MAEQLSTPFLDGILDRIRYRPTGANEVEARIALTILEDPDRVARESITAFARRASVSTGSVVRFAKLMGLPGYRDLKLALATAGAMRPEKAPQSASSLFRAHMEEQIRAVLLAADDIDPLTVEKAALFLANARLIDIVATGASVSVAHAVHFSLTLLGMHARFLPDTAEQAAAAAFLERGDVLLAISYSGRTRSIVDAADRALDAGASVLTFTCNARSTLARRSTIALVADASRGKFGAEWPFRTAMIAVARAMTLAIADHLPADELARRRSTWTSGRLGIRYTEH
jgi:DNA-binding MurR/RpiR family transcriptional regulator